MKQESRKQVYVQKSIQGCLALRCIVYWCCCLLSVFLFLFIGRLLLQQSTSPTEVFMGVYASHSAVILASLFLLPLVVWDMLKFSHRVVGPLIRLEREMRRLADGESVRPLQFREGDFWHGLARQFNALRTQHLRLNHQTSVTTDQEDKRAEEPVVVSR